MRSQVEKGTLKLKYVRISPWWVSIRRSTDSTAKSGMKRSAGGTRYETTSPRAMRARPGNRNRARA